MVGPSQRPIRCAIYRTAAGDELRVEYEDRDDDFLITELFRSDDEDGITTRAAEWRGKFDRHGFSELAIV